MCPTQPGVLHDILGIGGAAEHAIRDREEQFSVVAEDSDRLRLIGVSGGRGVAIIFLLHTHILRLELVLPLTHTTHPPPGK
jgi:hypothetical protein